MEEADALVHAAPARQHAEDAEHVGQAEHDEAEAVEAEVVADAELADPGDTHALEPGAGVRTQAQVVRVREPEDEHQDEAGGQARQGDPARRGFAAARDRPGDEAAGQRQTDEHCQKPAHRTNTVMATMTAAPRPTAPT